MKNLIIRFKKILAIGIAVLVGIVLAVIILRTEKTTVKDSHEGAESLHEGDEQVKGHMEADYYQMMIFRLRLPFTNGVFHLNLEYMPLIKGKRLALMK